MGKHKLAFLVPRLVVWYQFYRHHDICTKVFHWVELIDQFEYHLIQVHFQFRVKQELDLLCMVLQSIYELWRTFSQTSHERFRAWRPTSWLRLIHRKPFKWQQHHLDRQGIGFWTYLFLVWHIDWQTFYRLYLLQELGIHWFHLYQPHNFQVVARP